MILAAAGHGGDTSTIVVILVALVTVTPGILAFYYSVKSRREARALAVKKIGEDVGLGYAQTAFSSLKDEVARNAKRVQELENNQVLWERDREAWAQDKAKLLTRISTLSEQLNTTNGYLQLLLAVLDANGITAPRQPATLDLRIIKGDKE